MCVLGRRGAAGRPHLLRLLSEMSWFKYVTTGWGVSDSRYPLAPSALPPGQEIARKLSPGIRAS